MARIGLLPRVRCLRSLISANTPRQCPPPNFPVAAVDAIFPQYRDGSGAGEPWLSR